jgi:hypothetical protein
VLEACGGLTSARLVRASAASSLVSRYPFIYYSYNFVMTRQCYRY